MNTLSKTPFGSIKDLVLPAGLGASIPFVLLSFIILSNEEIFEHWIFLSLLIITSGGAVGGIFFYLMGFHWFPTGNKKLIAIILSIILYFVTLWISAVLAFALTGDWN
jgi:hypothetical protein